MNGYLLLNKKADDLANKEYLVTNGIGGYASSSISGANTRRYHGLIVAALQPPVDRMVMVSKIEESIFLRDTHVDLSTNYYPETVYPSGFRYIQSFHCKPFPWWIYKIEEALLGKSITMAPAENTTTIGYKNLGSSSLMLSLTPLFVYRDYHSLFHKDNRFNYYYEPTGNDLKIYAQYGAAPLFFSFNKGQFFEERDWFYDFCYYRERERGLDFKEDAYKIGKIECTLQPQEQLLMKFSTQQDSCFSEEIASHKFNRRPISNPSKIRTINHFYSDLKGVAEQFVVNRKSTLGKSIIAGYHWFSDWGRDSMIAMRGLCVSVGQRDVAQSIIRSFLHYLKDGLLPNNFPDMGEEPQYNSMDATLWLFVVLWEYHQKFEDKNFIASIIEDLGSILSGLQKGTRYQIHITEEGLLYGGQAGVQITWMDAKVDGQVITPRIGCPVEINALWYNALCIYREFSEFLEQPKNEIKPLINKVKKSFNQHFWNEEADCLYDVVVPQAENDPSIRPNQLYAISLPFVLLNKTKAKKVLKVIEDKLLTPYGLRSLGRDDDRFIGTYTGNQWQRDHAYHQGTVWTFLLGEYLLAYRYVNGDGADTKKYFQIFLKKLSTHFYEEGGLFCLSEIFDGAEPHKGKGCIQQAWSVGMLLRGLEGLFN